MRLSPKTSQTMHCVFLANHSKLPFTFCLIVWYPQYRQFDDPDYIRAEVDGARVARHLFFDPKPHSIRKPTDRCFFTSGKKKLAKESSSCMMFVWYSWYVFDTPQKNIWQTSFPFDFFSLFSGGIQSIPKKREKLDFRISDDAPPFEIQAFDAPRDTWQQMGWVGWVVGRPCWHPASRTGLEGHFSGANFAVKLSKRVKTRGFCLRGTFFSSPWNYLKKKVLQRNWFVNFFGCWLHTPNCIVMWWTKRFLIFLASNYLQRPPTQWWLTLLLRLHTSDVGVHVLPHLPSLEALRCPPWHLQIQVYCFPQTQKENL